jgi:hypothetical protein
VDDAGYLIRRPRATDLPGLRALATELWGPELAGTFDSRWWWNDNPPHCWVSEHVESGSIAAICGARRSQFSLEGKTIATTTINDWYVSSRHSGKGLGRALVNKCAEECDFLYTSAISDSAAVAFARMGWVGDIRYTMFIGSPHLAALWTHRMSRLISIERHHLGNGKPTDLTEIDAIWESLQWDAPAMMVRDGAFLRIHLELSGRRDHSLLVAKEGGRPIGYLLFRVLPPGSFQSVPFGRVGLISDYLVSRENTGVLRALVATAAGHFAAERVGLMLALASDSRHRSALHQLGLLSPTNALGQIGHRLSSRSMYLPTPGRSLLTANWHVTFADNDTDLILGTATGNPDLRRWLETTMSRLRNH